jgi:eukaryotic-like serine/threonine-protein kinase
MTPGEPGKTVDARWERLQELFSRAVELPPHEREAFITRETTSNAELRKELIELLACDTGASGPLTNALGAALDATSRDRRRSIVGRIVGNYKLVSVLGHGGTGTVYLGERADRQYSAQVAVKIVDTATVHGELGMRFRAERQILASLNHANIARLLDAGETPEGQPYLVMEYVHGEPLDRYCDRQQLDVRARLQLFLEICAAVQYAHQNLIVHRDLKPANILVTSEGTPKLLDFGIAKLLDSGDAAAVLALTRMNDRLLTPEYASPEQILGRPVTTASDVYALGVVLYELLTGLRPYTVPASASQLELERSICVSDPQRPSSAVRRAMETGPVQDQSEIGAIALARGLTPEKLQRRLTGDIDAIIMRTLRKEPHHRYGSVEQLAVDIRRYLTREPVAARQGNWLYYSQRFMRRHAFGVSAGAAFIIFIVAFAVTMSIQTQRIARERDRAAQEGERAEQVSQFMLEVFSAADPVTNKGETITATQLLENAGRRIRANLGEQPEVRARLLEAIGQAFRRQGHYGRSISYLEDALRLRRQISGSTGDRTANVLAELAIATRQAGDLTGSDRMLQQALGMAERNSDVYARLLTNLGRVEMQSGDLAGAEKHFRESLALNRELHGGNDPEVASVLMDLSAVYMWHDDLRSAEAAISEAVNIFAATLHPRHPDRVLAKGHLAQVLLLQGRVEEAGPKFEESLVEQRDLYGNDSEQVASVLDNLAKVRRAQGKLVEAEDYARQALAASVNSTGADHFATAYLRTSLAALLVLRGKYDEAETQIKGSLDSYAKTLPPDHQYVAASEYVLGEVYLQTNRLTEAEAVLTASMNRWKRTDAPAWRSARSGSALGEALYRQGRSREAERYLRDSFQVLAADATADRDARVKAQERVSRYYLDRGQRDKLEQLMLTATRDAKAAAQQAN